MDRFFAATICLLLAACQPLSPNPGSTPNPQVSFSTPSIQPSQVVVSPSPVPSVSPSLSIFPTATSLPNPDATPQFPLFHPPQLLIKGQPGSEDGSLEQAKIALFELHTFDKQGSLYFDAFDGRIRKMTTEGQIKTVLGTGVKGYKDGPAKEAQLSYSYDAAFDSKGNLWFLDYKNGVLRWLSPDGQVYTHAWKNDKSKYPFSVPQRLAIDSYDQIYVADEVRDPVYYLLKPSGELIYSLNASPYEVCANSYRPDFSSCVRGGHSLTLDHKDQLYIFIEDTHGIVRIENKSKVTPLIGPGSGFPNKFKPDFISSFRIDKMIYSKARQMFFLLERNSGCVRTLTHDGKPGALTSCDRANQPYEITAMALHPSEEVMYVSSGSAYVGEEPRLYKISLTDKPPSAYKP
ncbi:MAG: hypothetical protein AB7I41_12585 [Candidatus Sericytochromatia bacterium]